MTRVLIVDDDPGQLRMLAQSMSLRRRDLTVVTANTGSQAIEQLLRAEFDVVLTDLQMPEMSGFELLGWLASNRPQIPIFTMTAYPDSAAVDRLEEMGALECFTKPLDIGAVLKRLSRALSEGVGGHVRNIGLPAFLQLVEMERKTCVLTIESEGRVGTLHLDDGVLVDAHTGSLRGDEAATAIAAWPSPAITIRAAKGARRRTVERPLAFILLEAMRRHDEAGRATEPARPDPPKRARSRASFPLVAPPDADAIAIVDMPSGQVESAAGNLVGLDARVHLAITIFGAEMSAISDLALEDHVAELLLTTPRVWTVVRPLRSVPDTLVVLVFDPRQSTLVMQRLWLDELGRTLRGWCAGEDDVPGVQTGIEADVTRPLDGGSVGDEIDELADWGEWSE